LLLMVREVVHVSKRTELFQAAQKIINSEGVSKLTLDNVAKEAGISKGGLLHYFPNKNTLIKENIEHVLNNYSEGMEALDEKDDSPGQFLRSYAEVSLNNPQQLSAGLLAAIAVNPELLQPIQDHYDHWQKKIETDDLDPVLATIVRLAVDGLWFCDMFGLAHLENDMREQVLDRLKSYTIENKSK